MLPKRLELYNFLAYRQPDPISFEGMHLACLSGPNGAGKSSLLDAITWALWGKARVRSDDDLIHQGQSEMFVQLDFAQGDNLYRVVRRRQKAKKAGAAGRSALDLFAWDEDLNQWAAITAPSVNETTRRITELLRLEHETFVHSAFLQQGRADAFTVAAAGERKRLLSDILGLDQWEQYEERAKERLRAIKHNLDLFTMQIDEIARQELEEPALLRDLELREGDFAEAEKRRAEAEARYAEVAGAEEQMELARMRLAGAEHRIRQREHDLAEIDAELARLQKRLAALGPVIGERESIQEGYQRLQSARETDQALGEKLQAMSAIKDRLNEIEGAIQAQRADLEAQVSVHRDRIGTAQRAATGLEALQADLADVQVEIARLETQEASREALRQELASLIELGATLGANNKVLRKEMDDLKARLEQLEAAGAVCPLCGQPLSEEHRAQVLAEVQAEGKMRGDTYRDNVARYKETEAGRSAHEAAIKTLDGELRALQGLRDRAAKLDANVEAARSAAELLGTERSALGAIEAQLAAGDFAQELQAQRETIRTEIASLGYDSEAHSAVRETLSALSEYEERQRALDAALQEEPEVRARLEAAAARRARWEESLAQERAEAAAAQAEIEVLGERVEEARRREGEMREARAAEQRAHAAVVRVQQALAALENARQRKADLEKRRDEQLAEQGLYEELRDAFGKNGVPAMIIEVVIPELQESANHLLARMTGGRMHVRFDTQREKKTGGGVIETLDILISDELGTRSYDLYSGGEAFRVNFAIRVALSQMLARRAGAQLRTLFIDEGFGTQDEDGRQRLVEAITSIQDQFDLVLAITHIDELRDAFPVQIVVSKTPDGSRVSVR
ncbi:MAG: SMC family ATPase [Anaerolineae bacterium]|nr:SMC family ATPase [Anaerolineae bacterium]